MTQKTLELILRSLKSDRGILATNIKLRESQPQMFAFGTHQSIEAKRQRLTDLDNAICEVLDTMERRE